MYKVIVVDDEALVRNAICKKIDWETLGYTLAGTFENGEKAKLFLEENHVDVVLTDICMPYMDGMQLSEYLYHEKPEVNIIIFSGFDEFEYAKKAIQFAVREYLLKPVTAMELTGILLKMKQKLDAEGKEKLRQTMLKRVVNKNRIFLQSKALYKLISGSEMIAVCRQELAEMDIYPSGRLFCVAALEIKTEEATDLVDFIVFNITEELVLEKREGQVLLCGQNNLAVLFATENMDRERFELEINECLQAVGTTILEKTNLTVNIGVGNCVTRLEEVKKSYQQAGGALEYQYLFGDGRVFRTKKLPKKSGMEQDIRTFLEEICVAVKMNDRVEIEKGLKKIYGCLQQEMVEKTDAVVYLQICVKNLFLLLPVGQSENDMCTEESVMLAVERAGKLEMAVELVKDVAIRIGKRYGTQKQGEQTKIIIQIMDYIGTNYGDSELSLTSVCAKFGISISRFSAAFKARFHETFMEALTRIRMEHARELLEETDLRTYEVAERVGFSDPHYFGVAFKKTTGKSPKEWGRTYEKI